MKFRRFSSGHVNNAMDYYTNYALFPPEWQTGRLGQLQLDLGVEPHLLAEHELLIDPQELPDRLVVNPLSPRPHVDRVNVELEPLPEVHVGAERLSVHWMVMKDWP